MGASVVGIDGAAAEGLGADALHRVQARGSRRARVEELRRKELLGAWSGVVDAHTHLECLVKCVRRVRRGLACLLAWCYRASGNVCMCLCVCVRESVSE